MWGGSDALGTNVVADLVPKKGRDPHQARGNVHSLRIIMTLG